MIGPVLLLASLGCAPEPLGAEYGSIISINDGLEEIIFDAEYAVPGDGVGMLLMFDALVTNPEGIPANGIQVEVISGWTGTYVVSEGSVKMVTEFEINCDPADPDCAVWFDVQGEQYIEFAGEYASVSDFRPLYMSGVTDNRGIMPFYLFIDSLPYDENFEALPFSVYATIQHAAASFTIGA